MDEIMLEKILKEHETPIYVFDIKELKRRVKYLRKVLPSSVKLCYAIKANTFIIDEIEENVDRFEVCSPGEYEICKEKNIKANKILISGVNKSEESIKRIIDSSEVNYFTIESINQYEMLKKLNIKIKVMIRVTSGNQFGVNENEVYEIIEDSLKNTNIQIEGIQYFSGTQKTSIKKLKKEIEYIDSFIQKIEDKYDIIINELEFGTGFPVYYFENSEFDEDNFMTEFSSILQDINYKGNVLLEIGRSLAASSGYYITKVIDKKINKDERYAIVDGGMNHIVYYGQFMAMKTPMIDVIPKREKNTEEKWNICGSLCSINDILVKQFKIKDLDIGDVLIFKNTGAYCMTEGMSLFLSRDLPKVLKINEDSSITVLRENKPTYIFNM